MSNKGGKRHVKPHALSRAVKLHRKSFPWVSKVMPGPHPAELAIPLRLLLRDYLNLTKNSKESDKVISDGKILVDGKVRREPKFAVGFMDVVQLPAMNKSYRVLLDYKGRLVLNEISGEESSVKLCKVRGKQILKGKKIQLTLHDGKNLAGDLGSFKPGDVVKLGLPDQKVIERLSMDVGSFAFITDGANTGKVGKIEEIKVMRGPQYNTVVLRIGEKTLEAPQGYVFIIGKNKPEISISGVGA